MCTFPLVNVYSFILMPPNDVLRKRIVHLAFYMSSSTRTQMNVSCLVLKAPNSQFPGSELFPYSSSLFNYETRKHLSNFVKY